MRPSRVAARKLEGSQAGKWVGSAKEEERRLYETMRERTGAETDLMASCSSSGEEANSPSGPLSAGREPPPLVPLAPEPEPRKGRREREEKGRDDDSGVCEGRQ